MDLRFRNVRSAVVKLTNRCNIRCKYCYEHIVNKGDDMTSEVFQRLVDSIASSSIEDRLLLILHGGEPTILPEDWFEENLSQAHVTAKTYGKTLEISIQSNLINISDEKLRIFRAYGVGIGGSIDNPSTLKEALRPLAQRAVDTYLRARELGIRVGILATINQSNIGTMGDFCRWLLESLEVKHFKANVAYSVGAGAEAVTPTAESIFNAQKAIIDFMVENDGALIEENLAQEVIRFFENFHGGKDRSGTLCDDKLCGAGRKVVGVTPEGNILPCGRFAWNDSQYFLGALMEQDDNSAEEFLVKLDRFQELNPENWQHCNTCTAKDICGFGCQAFIVRSKLKNNIECTPTKMRFQYYQDTIDRLQGLYERICELENRRPMSRLDQKLSKLQQLVPPQYHVTIRDRLNQVLNKASF